MVMHETDNGFIARIIFANEARFTRDADFNTHSSHVHSPYNPTEEASGSLISIYMNQHSKQSIYWTIFLCVPNNEYDCTDFIRY